MVKGVEVMSHWTGLDVYLPDGRKLGIVHDAVIDADAAAGSRGNFPFGAPLGVSNRSVLTVSSPVL